MDMGLHPPFFVTKKNRKARILSFGRCLFYFHFRSSSSFSVVSATPAFSAIEDFDELSKKGRWARRTRYFL
jgi:hypothetical protein